MVMVRLKYNKKKKFSWEEMEEDDPDYKKKSANGKMVVVINERLWTKVQNIIKLKKKGWDSPICIDGKRRSGKSTLGKTLAYLLDPNLSIKNIVAGLEDAVDTIENTKDGSVIMFDESSLSFSSKDVMKKSQSQLLKIIDVCGQKRLTLIFILPTFFELSRPIAITHTLFLIHVYPDKKLNRGRFAYFGSKKKKRLYELGKKNFGSYAKPKSNFTGLFDNFLPPFEEEYLKLKKESLRQALSPLIKDKPPTITDLKRELVLNFRKTNPNMTDLEVANGFGIGLTTYYRYKRAVEEEPSTPTTP